MLNLRGSNDARFRPVLSPRRSAAAAAAASSLLLALAGACAPPKASVSATAAAPGADELLFAPDIAERLRQLPPTTIDYDRALLDERETRALQRLIEASRLLDRDLPPAGLPENPALEDRLRALGARGRAWRRERARVLPAECRAVGPARGQRALHRPARQAARSGVLPGGPGQARARGVARRAPGRKARVRGPRHGHPAGRQADSSRSPTRRSTASFLAAAAAKLREAAALTGNASLRNYLEKLRGRVPLRRLLRVRPRLDGPRFRHRGRDRTLRGLRGRALQLQGRLSSPS